MPSPRKRIPKNKPFLLLSTTASKKEAQKIASALLAKKKVACVTIVSGVDSWFAWKGKVDRAREWLLIIKTSERHIKSAEKLIRLHHSYAVPEIIGWPIRWGHAPYVKWLVNSTA